MDILKSELENLLIKETEKTPNVEFKLNEDRVTLNIDGASLSDNSTEFYKPLLDWIEEYSKNSANLTELNFKFKYFNNSSAKYIFDIFKKVESIHKYKGGVVVNWYYGEDDEDMLEAGEDFESAIRVPFKMIGFVD